MHESLENTAVDEHGIRGRRAFVVGVDRHHHFAAAPGVGHVDHRHERAGDALAEQVAGDRAAEHDVGLAGVAHGLVGQDAGEQGPHHHRVQAAACRHCVALGLQVAVGHGQAGAQGVCRQVDVVQAALGAEAFPHLDRTALVVGAGECDVDHGAADAVVHRAAVAGAHVLEVLFFAGEQAHRCQTLALAQAQRVGGGEAVDQLGGRRCGPAGHGLPVLRRRARQRQRRARAETRHGARVAQRLVAQLLRRTAVGTGGKAPVAVFVGASAAPGLDAVVVACELAVDHDDLRLAQLVTALFECGREGHRALQREGETIVTAAILETVAVAWGGDPAAARMGGKTGRIRPPVRSIGVASAA